MSRRFSDLDDRVSSIVVPINWTTPDPSKARGEGAPRDHGQRIHIKKVQPGAPIYLIYCRPCRQSACGVISSAGDVVMDGVRRAGLYRQPVFLRLASGRHHPDQSKRSTFDPDIVAAHSPFPAFSSRRRSRPAQHKYCISICLGKNGLIRESKW
jgi:hypothetical protein